MIASKSLKRTAWASEAYLSTLRDILIVFLIALPAFFRDGTNGMIRPSDSEFPLYPSDYLAKMSFTWFDKGWLFGNNGSFTSLSQRPYYFLPAGLQWLGFSSNLVNLGTWFILFSLLGLATYVMVRALLPAQSSIAGIVAASFYMYNPYMIGEIYLGHWFSFYAYAAVPIIFLGVIKGLRKGPHWQIWPFLIALLSIFVVYRVRLVPILVESIILYFVYDYLRNRSSSHIRHLISFLTLTLGAVIVVNFSWVLPSIGNLSSIYTLLTSSTIPHTSSLLVSPTFVDPLNILRLVGYGIPTWHASGQFYETGIGAYTTLAILGLSYSASWIYRRDPNVKFFTILAVAFTIPMLLLSQLVPATNLYLWFQGIAPTPLNLVIFPGSFEFWSVPVALSYAFLLGKVVDGFADSLGVAVRRWRFSRNRTLDVRSKPISPGPISKIRLRYWLASSLLIAIVLISSFPLIAGVPNDFASPIQIPQFYDQAREWLSAQRLDFAILGVPRSASLQYLKFDWAYGGMYYVTDILPQVSPVPVISPNLPLGSREGVAITDTAYSSLGDPNIADLLSLMGVKYIVLRNDVVSSPPNSSVNFTPPTGFSLEKSIGALEFFRNPTYSPIVSASESVVPVLGSEQAFVPLLYYPDISFSSTTFVFRNDTTLADFQFLLSKAQFLVDFNNPITDLALLNYLTSNDVRVVYVLDESPVASVKVSHAGMYNETDVLWNQNITSREIYLYDADYLQLPHTDVPMPRESFTVTGTSVPTDSAQVNDGSNQSTIQWKMNPNYSGFHALYISLNRTSWDLSTMARKGAGLGIDIYGDGSNQELRFSFMASGGRYFYWPLQTLYLNWTGWKRLYLPLAKFDQYGSPEWGDVGALWVWRDVSSSTLPHQLQIRALARDVTPRFSFFSPEQRGSNATTMIAPNSQEPLITWSKNSPVSYSVSSTSSRPFLLRLDTSYDIGWTASISGTKLQHFMVNSYANGFFVPASPTPVQINIAYADQNLSNAGNYVSLVSVAVIGIWAINGTRKSRPKKDLKPARPVETGRPESFLNEIVIPCAPEQVSV